MEVKTEPDSEKMPTPSQVFPTPMTPREEILGVVEQLAAITLLKPTANAYEALMDYLMLRDEGRISGDKIPFDPVPCKILGRLRELSSIPVVDHDTDAGSEATFAVPFKFNIPVPCCSRTFVLESERSLNWFEKLLPTSPSIVQERDVMSKVRAFSEMVLDATEYGQILMDIECDVNGNVGCEGQSVPEAFQFLPTHHEAYPIDEWVAQVNRTTSDVEVDQEKEAISEMPEANSPAPVPSSEFEFPELEYDSDEDFIGGDDEAWPEALLGEASDSVPILTDGGDVNGNVEPIPDEPSREDEISNQIHRLMAKINAMDEIVMLAETPAPATMNSDTGDKEEPMGEVVEVEPPNVIARVELLPTNVSSLPFLPDGDMDIELKLPLVRFSSDMVTRQEIELANMARQQQRERLDPRLEIPARNALYPAYLIRQVGVMGQVFVGNVGMFDAPFHAVALGLFLFGLMWLFVYVWTFAQSRIH